jgi:NADH-quinone oxidoreductase subunit N
MSISFALLPLLLTGGAACVVLLLGAFFGARARSLTTWAGVVAAVLVMVASAAALPGADQRKPILAEMWIADRMALLLDLVIATVTGTTLVVFHYFSREHAFERDEFPALVLFVASGMVMVVHATHLLSLLIGIETMSIAAYVLVASHYRSSPGVEGALKYFLMGAMATGFFVYGMALVYGTSGGELSFAGLAARAGAAGGNPLFIVGVYLILGALLFKVAAVPFHMWLPDAYEGAPTPVTGFMATGIKAAAVAGLIRLFGTAFANPAVAQGHAGWARLVGLIAFATMTLGNLAAIRQESVKRMLAYSSIAHAGYLLVGVCALGFGVTSARPALIFYLIAYSGMTLGAFTVAAWVGRRSEERARVDDWSGLARRRPALALAMTLFLLSLAGFPPTGGFFGKFYLFRAAVERPELMWLVVAAVLNSVISVYYYLRIVVAMYFRERPEEFASYPSLATGVVVVLLVVLVMGLGLAPSPVMAIVEPLL